MSNLYAEQLVPDVYKFNNIDKPQHSKMWSNGTVAGAHARWPDNIHYGYKYVYYT